MSFKSYFNRPTFALTSITLRGIGSYRTGQRLEIKPLTIICGPNGSGKSTWFKAIKMLRDSLDAGHLVAFSTTKNLNHQGKERTDLVDLRFSLLNDGRKSFLECPPAEISENLLYDHKNEPLHEQTFREIKRRMSILQMQSIRS